jgi:hypothetical protein
MANRPVVVVGRMIFLIVLSHFLRLMDTRNTQSILNIRSHTRSILRIPAMVMATMVTTMAGGD